MLFSSITFLYYFFPILLLIYFITPKKYKNIVLLIFSLIFYYYGEQKYIIILLFSCIFNYYIGKFIENNINNKKSKLYLIIGILVNIGLLLYFKYTNFFINNINLLFKSNLHLIGIIMPLGISFFTFQVLSYIIDIYNKKIKSCSSIINFSTYVCLFPQLVAGPIVRYKDINEKLNNRESTYKNISYGFSRFIIGLFKKVIIANSLGELCKIISGLEITVLSSWINAISYTLQIYFDFSGYSDMAIGLGSILGFKFLENFNYPYIASSITDFWRRWHISLSQWLRDYIYIPLGGNRVSKIKWIRNIFIVWFLTGFWHGASWNFIMWGLYFAIILLLEKKYFQNFLNNHKTLAHIYTILIIIISFVIFSNEDIKLLIINLKNMFFLNNKPFLNNEILYYLRSYIITIFLSCILSTPILKYLYRKVENKNWYKFISIIIEPLFLIAILILVTSYLIDSSYNPFLYFRF